MSARMLLQELEAAGFRDGFSLVNGEILFTRARGRGAVGYLLPDVDRSAILAIVAAHDPDAPDKETAKATLALMLEKTRLRIVDQPAGAVATKMEEYRRKYEQAVAWTGDARTEAEKLADPAFGFIAERAQKTGQTGDGAAAEIKGKGDYWIAKLRETAGIYDGAVQALETAADQAAVEGIVAQAKADFGAVS